MPPKTLWIDLELEVALLFEMPVSVCHLKLPGDGQQSRAMGIPKAFLIDTLSVCLSLTVSVPLFVFVCVVWLVCVVMT